MEQSKEFGDFLNEAHNGLEPVKVDEVCSSPPAPSKDFALEYRKPDDIKEFFAKLRFDVCRIASVSYVYDVVLDRIVDQLDAVVNGLPLPEQGNLSREMTDGVIYEQQQLFSGSQVPEVEARRDDPALTFGGNRVALVFRKHMPAGSREGRLGTTIIGTWDEESRHLYAGVLELTGAKTVRNDLQESEQKRGLLVRKGEWAGSQIVWVEAHTALEGLSDNNSGEAIPVVEVLVMSRADYEQRFLPDTTYMFPDPSVPIEQPNHTNEKTSLMRIVQVVGSMLSTQP